MERSKVTTPHKVTLSDVADRAGTSLSTASKALANQPRVSPATRQRVLKAAADLEYQPNAYAQSLVSGRSNTIGLITADLQGRFSTPLLIGAERELGIQQTSILLSNAQGNELLEQHHLQALLSRNVDGLIILNDETNPRPPIQGNIPVPIVYAYAPSTNEEDCSITCDNVGAGKLAFQHLLACGRKKIAVITGPKTFMAATDRVQGILEAAKESGLQLVEEPRYGQWDEAWGRGATRLLLDRKTDFDGVICGNDQIARGCIDALKERGISIPQEVAVIGHDNWDVLVSSSRPTLTSIDNQLEKIGAYTARYLMDAINGDAHHGIESLPCRLIQRESTLPIY
jgi:LacI family transcriptional regulator